MGPPPRGPREEAVRGAGRLGPFHVQGAAESDASVCLWVRSHVPGRRRDRAQAEEAGIKKAKPSIGLLPQESCLWAVRDAGYRIMNSEDVILYSLRISQQNAVLPERMRQHPGNCMLAYAALAPATLCRLWHALSGCQRNSWPMPVDAEDPLKIEIRAGPDGSRPRNYPKEPLYKHKEASLSSVPLKRVIAST